MTILTLSIHKAKQYSNNMPDSSPPRKRQYTELADLPSNDPYLPLFKKLQDSVDSLVIDAADAKQFRSDTKIDLSGLKLDILSIKISLKDISDAMKEMMNQLCTVQDTMTTKKDLDAHSKVLYDMIGTLKPKHD